MSTEQSKIKSNKTNDELAKELEEYYKKSMEGEQVPHPLTGTVPGKKVNKKEGGSVCGRPTGKGFGKARKR